MRLNYIFAIFIALQTSNLTGLFSQSVDKNYILTRTMLNEEGSSYLDAIQYYDGLGRPTQLVQKGVTPSGADLVTMQEYDLAGRTYRSWIPTPFPNNGNYVDNFTSEASAKHNGDNYPYAETQYDGSPLNRVLKETGAGALWHTKGKGISNRYLTNTTSGILRVTNYSVDASGSLSNKGAYPSAQLECTETTDENGNITYTFTDKLGQTILTRQMNGTEPHDTYYVYDDFGNLSYVLPPMVDGNISVENLNKYAYRYQYDDRNRCIEIKLPGCEPIYQIYDKSDRLVLRQDGNQRIRGVWFVNKYDKLGRLLYTSEVEEETSLDELRSNFSNWLVTEGFTTDSQEYPMEDTGYSRGFYHRAPTTLLTVNYYDDYRFLELLPEKDKMYLEYSSRIGFPAKYDNAKGLLTGTRTYILNDASMPYISTVYYYDAHGNVIQKLSNNHMGGYDFHYYAYTFTGKLLKDRHEHQAIQPITYPETYSYVYDHAERVSETVYNGLGQTIVSTDSYDELGRLSQKTINNDMESIEYEYNLRDWVTVVRSPSFSETIDYSGGYNGNISRLSTMVGNEEISREYFFRYDGLDRLTAATYGYCTSGYCAGSNYYNVMIDSYDKHGNIERLTRRGLIDPTPAQTRIVNGGEGTPSAPLYGVIDDLSLSYEGNQLKSVSDVSENDPVYKDAMHFIDDANVDIEYVYDANGNMTNDRNHKLTARYNSLNLPSTIEGIGPSFFGSLAFLPVLTYADYIYSADGTKLRASYGSVERSYLSSFPMAFKTDCKMDYCGNFIYENDTLSRVLINGGYIDCRGNRSVVYFYLQDHQGNNRVVLDTNDSILQVNHYYPFGALFGESSNGELQKYKYNGKELDRMYGLDWYDYGARWLDPVLGRFTTMDPLCEKYYSVSPYAYCNNNPVKYVDPSGMFFSTDVKWNEDGTYTVVGGEADDDLNIYLTEDGKRTGEIIGRSLTEYSFLDENGIAIEGAIIDPSDQSGMDFISNEIIKGDPNILSYMPNATGGEKYDFKRLGYGSSATKEQMYRGMPFNDSGIYASARDIGNWGAGYVAGKSGLSWGMARFGFDALESWQHIKKGQIDWYREGQPTQQAERVGYQAGQIIFHMRLIEMLVNFIK